MLRLLLRAYLLRRLFGGGHRRPGGWYSGSPGGSYTRSPGGWWGAPRDYGYERMRRPRGGLFGPYYRPRRRTQVRGCGCCLPIPLGVLTISAIALRALLRARSR